jgi:hypothetical protein
VDEGSPFVGRDTVAVLKSEIDIANRLGNNNRRNLTYTVMA